MPEPRFRVADGKVYLTREVLPEEQMPPEFKGCEYATLTADGARLSWHPYGQGDEVEPLGEVESE
jgi:hypothetical protein